MDEEHNYTPNENKNSSVQPPKLFSLTRIMTQRENIDSNRGHPTPIDMNSPFRPRRKAGLDQNMKRAIIFPNLQRFQRPVQQSEQKPLPFFSLLNSNAPTGSPTPSFTSGRLRTEATHIIDHGAKVEPISDLDFSSPPPPFQEPPQMLPPPPPPTGPISRPSSRAGSRSRSSSCISLSQDEKFANSPNSATPKLNGLPDIAINALRELQAVTSELDDQKRQTQTLLTQLNSLNLTHDELKTAHNNLIEEHDSVQRQLSVVKNDLESANELASNSSVAISATKIDLASSQQQLGSAQEELESAKRVAEEVRIEANRTREAFTLQKEDAKERFGKARKALADMNDRYKDLRTMFEGLQVSHQTSQDFLQEMRMARSAAADGLRVLEPMLGEGGSYGRASEVKSLVSELRDEIADSHRVNDLLRDKLHHQSSQLAQANERVRDLEVNERSRLGELVGVLKGEHGGINSRQGEILEKVERLTARLKKREEEAIDALAEAAGLKTELDITTTTLEEVRETLKGVRAEAAKLRDVQNEKRDLEARLDTLATKFTHEQEELRTTLEQWNEARGRGEANAAIITSLQNAVRALELEKATSVNKLREVQAARKDAEDKLAAELIRKENSETEIAALRKLHKDHGAELRDIDSRMATLQERFDAQAITLRLAKEHCGDVQEACQKAKDALVAEIAKGASLGARVGFLEDELAKVKEDGLSREGTRAAEATRGAAARARVDALETELGQARNREALLQDARKRAEEDLAKVRKESADREETIRQERNNTMLLKDRYDAQAATLRATKEHCSDLQERLSLAEVSFATKLTSATGKLEAEIAVLKERNSAIQRMLDDAKCELSTQQAAFVGASVDFNEKLAKQEKFSDQLVNAERARGDVFDREASDARRVVVELQERVEGLREEVRRATQRGESVEMEKVKLLQDKVEELGEVNKALVLHAGNLKERYSGGNLSDNEKDFVEYLMKLAYSLHEQEDVAKDNELRRRDNMIITLQTRIRELESSLARVLQERQADAGNMAKSMVDLSLWMTSSPLAGPDHADPADLFKESNIAEENLKPYVTTPSLPVMPNEYSSGQPGSMATSTAESLDSTTMTTRVPAKSKAKTKPKIEPSKPAPQPTFSKLAADSDSEDDVPLSELSDISTILGKRDRVPSPAKEKTRGTRSQRTTTRQVGLVPSSQQTASVSQKKTADPTKPKKKRKQ